MAYDPMSSLLLAVRDHLRANLSLDARDCEVMEDERPAPKIGKKYFYSVHPLEWTPGDLSPDTYVLDESFGVSVSVSCRISGSPRDMRMSSLYLRQTSGLAVRLRNVALKVDQNYVLLVAADVYFGTAGSFIEPLNWIGSDHKPRVVEGKFFGADEKVLEAGLVMETRFTGARMIVATTP